MLRVCGVTFSHTINYGSCLQAFALQNAIDRLDISGEHCSMELISICCLKDYRATIPIKKKLLQDICKVHFISYYKKCIM